VRTFGKFAAGQSSGHACFFVPALMFLSLILEPPGRRRLPYGAAMRFVLTFGVRNGLMGALLTFSTHPFCGYRPS
jgi:hypothetical protein